MPSSDSVGTWEIAPGLRCGAAMASMRSWPATTGGVDPAADETEAWMCPPMSAVVASALVLNTTIFSRFGSTPTAFAAMAATACDVPPRATTLKATDSGSVFRRSVRSFMVLNGEFAGTMNAL